jgi:hypothetical protein
LIGRGGNMSTASLCLFWAARGTPARFLFERPSPFWLALKRLVLQPAQ